MCVSCKCSTESNIDKVIISFENKLDRIEEAHSIGKLTSYAYDKLATDIIERIKGLNALKRAYNVLQDQMELLDINE